MVDFTQRVKQKHAAKPIDPIELYDTLDRASDKGPLRPIQVEVLSEWHKKRRAERDVILKLHTGQGKTLVGLLMLLSKLNEGKGPALYLCPNNFLVGQTVEQAKAFGVRHVTTDGPLPSEFIDGQAILITTVHKLFTGLSKFGVGIKGEPVGALVMDDCHACIDVIEGQTRITVPRKSNAYQPLLNLFATELAAQRPGTFAEIQQESYDSIIAVPYWGWLDRVQEVTELLLKHVDDGAIKFTWPLLKDSLAHCLCVVSGHAIEISPYLAPIWMFPSYAKAAHRVFMSATVTDDSFLIKGLAVAADAIREPLVHKDESWSGEKMILIPSLIDQSLDRQKVIERFTPAFPRKDKYGVAALTPSFGIAGNWGTHGGVVAKPDTIESLVEDMRKETHDKTVVFANRYDGIDLPDQACRILIMDSLPTPESLTERYVEQCRPASEAVTIKITRTIEQGLGRSVRGEKDYSVIVLIGPDLIRHVQTGATRKHFSDQTRAQIEMGLEIAKFAVEEIQGGKKPIDAFVGLINQCIQRESGWKNYYIETMNEMPRHPQPPKMLDRFEAEAEAEALAIMKGDSLGAAKAYQELANTFNDPADGGWYLEQMARHMWNVDRSQAETIQGAAHNRNPFVLKPKGGIPITKLLEPISHKRVERIIAWLQKRGSHPAVMIEIDEVLGRLDFGVKSERFESALGELAWLLGFAGQRPDREIGAGPDNLWQVADGEYVLWEAKNEVALDRELIFKGETGQFNNACGWFDQNYPGAKLVGRVMITPAKKCAPGAHFNHDARLMGPHELKKFKANIRAFFAALIADDFSSLSEQRIQDLLTAHKLNAAELTTQYSKPVKE